MTTPMGGGGTTGGGGVSTSKLNFGFLQDPTTKLLIEKAIQDALTSSMDPQAQVDFLAKSLVAIPHAVDPRQAGLVAASFLAQATGNQAYSQIASAAVAQYQKHLVTETEWGVFFQGNLQGTSAGKPTVTYDSKGVGTVSFPGGPNWTPGLPGVITITQITTQVYQ